MLQPITYFRGKNFFLSNSFPIKVKYQGRMYPSAEHAFQAVKTFNDKERAWIAAATGPGFAKQRGRQVELRQDWDHVKIPLMDAIVREKFASYSLLTAMLVATLDRELIHGNVCGDTYWGVCAGEGKNLLGRILMTVRRDLNMSVGLLIRMQEKGFKTREKSQ